MFLPIKEKAESLIPDLLIDKMGMILLFFLKENKGSFNFGEIKNHFKISKRELWEGFKRLDALGLIEIQENELILSPLGDKVIEEFGNLEVQIQPTATMLSERFDEDMNIHSYAFEIPDLDDQEGVSFTMSIYSVDKTIEIGPIFQGCVI